MLGKIISGGQTGVDRAALDVAMALKIPAGGWCPKGRRSEDGTIPERYDFLKETKATSYSVRTGWNIRDSDGTLILNIGILKGGTELTLKMARQQHKPCLVVQLDDDTSQHNILGWIEENSINVLNIAGPREFDGLQVHKSAESFLRKVLLNS